MTHDSWAQKYIGKGIDFDGKYSFQCVDVYRQYLKDVCEVPQSAPVVGAADIWQSFRKEDFEQIKNDPTNFPKKGDIVILKRAKSNGNFGHVAIVDSATATSMTVLEQDGLTNSVLRRRTMNYTNVLGWLRKKGQSQAQPLKEDAMSDLLKKYGVKNEAELDSKLFEHVGTTWGDDKDPNNNSYLASARRERPNLVTKEHAQRQLRELDAERTEEFNLMVAEKDQIIAEKVTKILNLETIASTLPLTVPKQDDLIKRFTSRKFLLTVLGFAIPLLNERFNLGLSLETVVTILAPIMLFVGAEGWKDIKSS